MDKWWQDYGNDASWEPGQKYTYSPDGCCLIKVTKRMLCEHTGQVFELGECGTKEIDWLTLFQVRRINTTGKKGKDLVRLIIEKETGLKGEELERYLRNKLKDWD